MIWQTGISKMGVLYRKIVFWIKESGRQLTSAEGQTQKVENKKRSEKVNQMEVTSGEFDEIRGI